MRQHLIPNTDLMVSTLCYGAGGFGTVVRDDALERLIDQFCAAGGNFFDTAHCYSFWVDGGLGASERALGAYLRKHGGAQRLVVATKGGHPCVPPAYLQPDDYLSAKAVAQQIDESLERLGIPTIDIFLLHRDDPRLPVGEIIEMLNEQIRRGGIRYLGASNWSTKRIAAANNYASAHGLQGFIISEPLWSLAQPKEPRPDPTMHVFTDDDHEWHLTTAMPVMPYSPTANGYFATEGRAAAAVYDTPENRRRLERVEILAHKLRCTPNQLALAYLLHQDFPVIPILGTTNPAHLADALAAPNINLTRPTVLAMEGEGEGEEDS